MSRFENPQATNFTALDSAVTRREIESELQRVLNDPEFLKNGNSAKFLKFVVDETLDGRGARLKAYTIATMALEREASFDPQTNSIVRVQAMRLRELLEGYYSGAGAADPVQISLRRGTYQPGFGRRAEPADAPAEVSVAEPPPWNTRRPFPNRTMALIVGLAVAATALVAWSRWANPSHGSNSAWREAAAGTLDGPPSVVVYTPDLVLPSPGTARFSARLFGSIEEGLSSFDYIALRSLSFRRLPPTENGYVLTGRFMDSVDARADVAMSLMRVPSGEVVWSRHYDDVNAGDRNAVDSLANSVVAELGDPNGGAIFADIRDRLQKAPLLGYACLIGGVEYLRSRLAERRAVERKCLKSEVDDNPDNIGALTLLSAVLVRGYLEDAPESSGIADLQRASQLARRATDLAPQRSTALGALFVSRFYDKRFDDAFQAARAALVANSNASLVAEPIASAYISRGMYAEGLALLRPLEAANFGPPIGSIPFLALAAHMRGDANAAFEYAQRPGAASTPLGLTMRIVTCREHDDQRGAAAAATQLRVDFPGFARDIAAALDRYAMIEAIKTVLLRDLAAAGYAPTTAE